MKTGARTAVLLVLGLFAAGVVARWNLILNRPLAGFADNEDSASHVLATAKCYRQASWRVHYGLPIFTFAATQDKGIDDLPSASRQDKAGNVYYTSFPPGVFLAGYLVANAGDPIVSLRLFNVLLQGLTSLLLGGLAYKASGNWLAACAAAAVYAATPESLKSHSIGFWAQQVYAPIMVVQVGLATFRPRSPWLPAIGFFACLLEWTAFPLGMGVTLCGWLRFRKTGDRADLWAAVANLCAILAGGLTLIGWYGLIMDPKEYLVSLGYRAGVRSTRIALMGSLVLRYGKSFGAFLVPMAASLMLIMSKRSRQWGCWGWIFVLYGSALLENIVMGDHALKYSYDRLKGVQVSALLIAWAAAEVPKWRTAIFGSCLAAGVLSIALIWFSFDFTQDFQSLEYTLHEKLGGVVALTASDKGPAFLNDLVRGHTLYYSGRNLVQGTESAAEYCRSHGWSEGTTYELSQDLRSVRVMLVQAGGTKDERGVFKLGEYTSRALNGDWITEQLAWFAGKDSPRYQ